MVARPRSLDGAGGHPSYCVHAASTRCPLNARPPPSQVLLLLTDVDGLYDRPPSEPGAAIIPEYYRDVEDVSFRIGDKSAQGRGGMKAKVDSAMRALDVGVKVVVPFVARPATQPLCPNHGGDTCPPPATWLCRR